MCNVITLCLYTRDRLDIYILCFLSNFFTPSLIKLSQYPFNFFPIQRIFMSNLTTNKFNNSKITVNQAIFR